MRKATGYVRVSTTGQAIDGVSLDAQEAKIRAWATLHDYELTGIHVDAGISGSKMHTRPGLQAALDESCAEGSALVVYSLSRLARSTADAIAISDRLHRAGADLVSLSEAIDTTTAAGKMVFRMLAVLAEFERDLVSERTSAAMQHKASHHEYTGGEPPYGWAVGPDGVNLVVEPTEQQIILLAGELRESGLSLRAVGASLVEQGYLPRSGGRWHAKTVQSLLNAEAA